MLNANAIDWFAHIALELHNFFAKIASWIMGELPGYTWPGRLIKTDSTAYEEYSSEEANNN
jgi:hypothetical protein